VLNSTSQRTLDSSAEFAECRDRFFSSPLAEGVVRWSFPGSTREAVQQQVHSLCTTEEFQAAYVNPALQRILRQTSLGLSISGLEQLPPDRKFVFISNHRCIVTDAALVSLNLLASGRGTCKVCVGDNLMTVPGVTELMLLLNGVSIKRSGSRRDVYANAQHIAAYVAQQIAEQRYSVWLSQSPGRTKDGNDHTDPAIIKMLGLHGARSRADYEKLHIVPVAISYEYEPCGVQKVRETLLRQQNGSYQKQAGEDVGQIRDSLTLDKGHIHLAFGQELQLNGSTENDLVQDIVNKIDAQIWSNYRLWTSNHIAHALLTGGEWDFNTPYAQNFMRTLEGQIAELAASGLARTSARTALLQLYAQPVFNATTPRRSKPAKPQSKRQHRG
jgi:hypothetical protein